MGSCSLCLSIYNCLTALLLKQAFDPFRRAFGTATGTLFTGIIIRSTGNYRWSNIGTQAFAGHLHCSLRNHGPGLALLVPICVPSRVRSGFGTYACCHLDCAHKLGESPASSNCHLDIICISLNGFFIGLTICSVVFQNILRTGLWSRLGHMNYADRLIRRIRESFDEVCHLAACCQGSDMAALNAVLSSLIRSQPFPGL